jgi:RimJ/RimL family protein N-acetyltransferase
VLPDLPGGHLTDGVVTLRVLRAGDAAACHALRSRPEAYLTRVPPEPPTLRQTQHQCTTAESRWLAGDFARLAICDVRGGELVGEIGLFLIEPPTRQGTLGYDLAPAWRGRGYATRAARLVAAWAFGAAGFDRLTAGTRVDNVASQRVLQRCGFRQEGLERGRLPGPDGLRYDHVLYGLLPADLTGSDQLSPTRR